MKCRVHAEIIMVGIESVFSLCSTLCGVHVLHTYDTCCQRHMKIHSRHGKRHTENYYFLQFERLLLLFLTIPQLYAWPYLGSLVGLVGNIDMGTKVWGFDRNTGFWSFLLSSNRDRNQTKPKLRFNKKNYQTSNFTEEIKKKVHTYVQGKDQRSTTPHFCYTSILPWF